jgi:hypothetical protein
MFIEINPKVASEKASVMESVGEHTLPVRATFRQWSPSALVQTRCSCRFTSVVGRVPICWLTTQLVQRLVRGVSPSTSATTYGYIQCQPMMQENQNDVFVTSNVRKTLK